MNKLVQVVSPNLGQKTNAGWCLMFTQNSFGAPVMYPSATEAANATKLRNSSRTMPYVSVPVWFDHWGYYGPFGNTYANWGHVVVWVPGRGFLSSPVSGFGQLWLSSLDAVEKTFNSKYRFWSLDINTLQVATPSSPPTPELPEEIGEEMFVIKMKNGRWYLVVPNGAGKMRATWLPGKSGASETGLPIFDYAKASDEHMKQLRAAVDGL